MQAALPCKKFISFSTLSDNNINGLEAAEIAELRRSNIQNGLFGQSGIKPMTEECENDDLMNETQMIIIHLTKNYVHQLALDPVGNKLLQHLLQFPDQSFINHLLLSLIRREDWFLALCLDDRRHQILVNLISRVIYPCQEWTIVLVVSRHALRLAKSWEAGHRVLKGCFKNLSPKANELILLRIAQSCYELARHQAGCYILQTCIEYSYHYKGQLQEVLFSPLVQDAHNLSMHAYGNYVIQFMIELDGANTGRRIMNQLTSKFVELCMDKFGSNVVEKCLRCCEGGADEIVFEILGNPQNQLISVCTNEYGNYVIQTAMSVAKGDAYRLLVRAIKSHSLVLRFHPFGKKVLKTAPKQ